MLPGHAAHWRCTLAPTEAEGALPRGHGVQWRTALLPLSKLRRRHTDARQPFRLPLRVMTASKFAELFVRSSKRSPVAT